MSRIDEIMLLDEAEGDLDDAYVWYELHKPGLGVSFILEVEKSFTHILQYPLASAKQFKDTSRFVMKRFPYSIYYKIDDTSTLIQIIGILHHKRDIKTMKNRM